MLNIKLITYFIVVSLLTFCIIYTRTDLANAIFVDKLSCHMFFNVTTCHMASYEAVNKKYFGLFEDDSMMNSRNCTHYPQV